MPLSLHTQKPHIGIVHFVQLHTQAELKSRKESCNFPVRESVLLEGQKSCGVVTTLLKAVQKRNGTAWEKRTAHLNKQALLYADGKKRRRQRKTGCNDET